MEIISLHVFSADPITTETIQLKKQYHEQRKKITKAYQQGDFLEITLQNFYSPE